MKREVRCNSHGSEDSSGPFKAEGAHIDGPEWITSPTSSTRPKDGSDWCYDRHHHGYLGMISAVEDKTVH